jgi:hypothetical protein
MPHILTPSRKRALYIVNAALVVGAVVFLVYFTAVEMANTKVEGLLLTR